MMMSDDYPSKKGKKKVFGVGEERETREIRFFSLSLTRFRRDACFLCHKTDKGERILRKTRDKKKKQSPQFAVREKNTQHKKKQKNKKNVALGSLFVPVRVRSEDDDDENVFFYHLSDHVLFASEC